MGPWGQIVLKESQLRISAQALIGKIEPINLNILMTSRQVFSEARAYMYREAKLIIYHNYDQVFVRDEETKMVPKRYALRSQSTSQPIPGVMYPAELGSFQNIHINHNLPDMDSMTILPASWQTSDDELLRIIEAVSRRSTVNPWSTKLQITFWEPSVLFAYFEDRASTYTHFLRSMRNFKTATPETFNELFAFKKNLLNLAMTRSRHRHPLQVEVMQRQRRTLQKIEAIVEQVNVKVDTKVARDWRMCAFLVKCRQSQPFACGPAYWDQVWLPGEGESVDDWILDEIAVLDLPKLQKTVVGREIIKMSGDYCCRESSSTAVEILSTFFGDDFRA
jgi:hypothetical protein